MLISPTIDLMPFASRMPHMINKAINRRVDLVF